MVRLQIFVSIFGKKKNYGYPLDRKQNCCYGQPGPWLVIQTPGVPGVSWVSVSYGPLVGLFLY